MRRSLNAVWASRVSRAAFFQTSKVLSRNGERKLVPSRFGVNNYFRIVVVFFREAIFSLETLFRGFLFSDFSVDVLLSPQLPGHWKQVLRCFSGGPGGNLVLPEGFPQIFPRNLFD